LLPGRQGTRTPAVYYSHCPAAHSRETSCVSYGVSVYAVWVGGSLRAGGGSFLRSLRRPSLSILARLVEVSTLFLWVQGVALAGGYLVNMRFVSSGRPLWISSRPPRARKWGRRAYGGGTPARKKLIPLSLSAYDYKTATSRLNITRTATGGGAGGGLRSDRFVNFLLGLDEATPLTV
jgi:hypothetical protein